MREWGVTQPQPAPTINVTVENKTSAVEAASLLRNLEKDAQDKIEKSLNLVNNEFNVVISKCISYISMGTDYHISFRLNGQKYTTHMNIDKELLLYQVKDANKEIVRMIVDKIVTVLVEEHFLNTPNLIRDLIT